MKGGNLTYRAVQNSGTTSLRFGSAHWVDVYSIDTTAPNYSAI